MAALADLGAQGLHPAAPFGRCACVGRLFDALREYGMIRGPVDGLGLEHLVQQVSGWQIARWMGAWSS